MQAPEADAPLSAAQPIVRSQTPQVEAIVNAIRQPIAQPAVQVAHEPAARRSQRQGSLAQEGVRAPLHPPTLTSASDLQPLGHPAGSTVRDI